MWGRWGSILWRHSITLVLCSALGGLGAACETDSGTAPQDEATETESIDPPAGTTVVPPPIDILEELSDPSAGPPVNTPPDLTAEDLLALETEMGALETTPPPGPPTDDGQFNVTVKDSNDPLATDPAAEEDEQRKGTAFSTATRGKTDLNRLLRERGLATADRAGDTEDRDEAEDGTHEDIPIFRRGRVLKRKTAEAVTPPERDDEAGTPDIPAEEPVAEETETAEERRAEAAEEGTGEDAVVTPVEDPVAEEGTPEREPITEQDDAEEERRKAAEAEKARRRALQLATRDRATSLDIRCALNPSSCEDEATPPEEPTEEGTGEDAVVTPVAEVIAEADITTPVPSIQPYQWSGQGYLYYDPATIIFNGSSRSDKYADPLFEVTEQFVPDVSCSPEPSDLAIEELDDTSNVWRLSVTFAPTTYFGACSIFLRQENVIIASHRVTFMERNSLPKVPAQDMVDRAEKVMQDRSRDRDRFGGIRRPGTTRQGPTPEQRATPATPQILPENWDGNASLWPSNDNRFLTATPTGKIGERLAYRVVNHPGPLNLRCNPKAEYATSAGDTQAFGIYENNSNERDASVWFFDLEFPKTIRRGQAEMMVQEVFCEAWLGFEYATSPLKEMHKFTIHPVYADGAHLVEETPARAEGTTSAPHFDNGPTLSLALDEVGSDVTTIVASKPEVLHAFACSKGGRLLHWASKPVQAKPGETQKAFEWRQKSARIVEGGNRTCRGTPSVAAWPIRQYGNDMLYVAARGMDNYISLFTFNPDVGSWSALQTPIGTRKLAHDASPKIFVQKVFSPNTIGRSHPLLTILGRVADGTIAEWQKLGSNGWGLRQSDQHRRTRYLGNEIGGFSVATDDDPLLVEMPNRTTGFYVRNKIDNVVYLYTSTGSTWSQNAAITTKGLNQLPSHVKIDFPDSRVSNGTPPELLAAAHNALRVPTDSPVEGGWIDAFVYIEDNVAFNDLVNMHIAKMNTSTSYASPSIYGGMVQNMVDYGCGPIGISQVGSVHWGSVMRTTQGQLYIARERGTFTQLTEFMARGCPVTIRYQTYVQDITEVGNARAGARAQEPVNEIHTHPNIFVQLRYGNILHLWWTEESYVDNKDPDQQNTLTLQAK